MPAGLIDEQRGVRARRDLGGDFGQVQVHRLGVASGHDEGCALAVLGADRAEDIGGDRSLIFGSARARAALGPRSPSCTRRMIGASWSGKIAGNRGVARAIVRRSKPIAYCRLAFGQTV